MSNEQHAIGRAVLKLCAGDNWGLSLAWRKGWGEDTGVMDSKIAFFKAASKKQDLREVMDLQKDVGGDGAEGPGKRRDQVAYLIALKKPYCYVLTQYGEKELDGGIRCLSMDQMKMIQSRETDITEIRQIGAPLDLDNMLILVGVAPPAPNLPFKEMNKIWTLRWLFERKNELRLNNDQIGRIYTGEGVAPTFAGIPDLLPFLRDDDLLNLKSVLEEVAGGGTQFSLRSVARIKQAMREAAGIGGEPAALAIEPAQQGTTESVQPDMKEVQGKLQRVEAKGKYPIKVLAEIISRNMSFHHESLDEELEKLGINFITKLYTALAGDGNEEQNVRHARQLKIVGPSNNGKTELAQWMARMWVASAQDGANGGWIETYVTMETMDAHLWSARESTGSAPREVWGELRYLFDLARQHQQSRFALVLHESNRGGLFNALNRIWWEKRRNYPRTAGVPKGEQLPPNLALIFTENPKTADYATIGDGDDALLTRLPPESTFALVRSGTSDSELNELGFSGEEGRHFSTENVGLIYAAKNAPDEMKPAFLQLARRDTTAGTSFQSHFKVRLSVFRKKVAGEQIQIIRDHPNWGYRAPPPAALPPPPQKPEPFYFGTDVFETEADANAHVNGIVIENGDGERGTLVRVKFSTEGVNRGLPIYFMAKVGSEERKIDWGQVPNNFTNGWRCVEEVDFEPMRKHIGKGEKTRKGPKVKKGEKRPTEDEDDATDADNKRARPNSDS